MSKHWYHKWFNSPYYHVLYQNRDEAEASRFIDHVIRYTKLPPAAQLLDIACGRGRHSVYLHQQGFNVTAIDLSIANIAFAKQFEQPGLRFFVHDMRALFYDNYFDAAFNLFTSFGYFDREGEHLKALRSFNHALKPGGLLILDYFNSHKVISRLVADDVKVADGITFHIHKEIEGCRVIKEIGFTDDGEHHFKESVRLFSTDDFESLFRQSGFTVEARFGSYGMEPFNTEQSDRLIFICKKQHA